MLNGRNICIYIYIYIWHITDIVMILFMIPYFLYFTPRKSIKYSILHHDEIRKQVGKTSFSFCYLQANIIFLGTCNNISLNGSNDKQQKVAFFLFKPNYCYGKHYLNLPFNIANNFLSMSGIIAFNNNLRLKHAIFAALKIMQ